MRDQNNLEGLKEFSLRLGGLWFAGWALGPGKTLGSLCSLNDVAWSVRHSVRVEGIMLAVGSGYEGSCRAEGSCKTKDLRQIS